jgi:cholesterol transport system auxiliary component
MNQVAKIIFSFSFILVIISGCFGKQHPPVKIDYYSLEYELNKFDELKPTPFVLRIERFSVSPLYNSSNIIYKTKQFKLDAYNYHKWRANPGDMVTFFLSRDLKNSSLFKAIFEHGSRFSSSHVISGSVDEFFEEDEQYSWKAVLAVSITLIKENEADISKRILFQKSYSANKKCTQKNPRAIANAMSSAMASISEKIITDVYKSLAVTE